MPQSRRGRVRRAKAEAITEVAADSAPETARRHAGAQQAARPDVLEEALEHLVRGIVEHPDDVQVGSRGLRRGRVLEVRVHPDDLGQGHRPGRTHRQGAAHRDRLAGRQQLRPGRPAGYRRGPLAAMQLVVGRITRPHGVRGELAVEVRTDDPELRLAAGAVLATEPAAAGPLTVAAHALALRQAAASHSTAFTTGTRPTSCAACCWSWIRPTSRTSPIRTSSAIIS